MNETEATRSTMSDLVGRTVTGIWWSDDRLVFATDAGPLAYEVDGDCCSYSYFYDFYGVAYLLENGPVTGVEDIELSPGDVGYRAETWEDGAGLGGIERDDVDVYGYRLTTDHPRFGPVSSVVSFRNSNNGYYGGWMQRIDPPEIDKLFTLITSDVTGE